nr:uncharacterized protein LOC111429412 [Onthophagus taurus]
MHLLCVGFALILGIFGVYAININDYGVQYAVYPSQQQVEYAPKKLRQREKEEKQDFSKIPGKPGVDYPIFHVAPPTHFSCHNVPAHPGMYADVETGCQVYHVCHDGREGEKGATFLCTNGTIFNQAEFTCDWWYNVNCHEAQSHYRLNLDPEKNPYFPKKKVEEQQEQHYQEQPQQQYYPAQYSHY